MVLIRKDRIGKPLPKMCEGNASSNGLVVYSFGYATQEVLNCPATEQVLLSKNACLRSFEDNAYVSADFKAQGNVNGDLIFSASITYKPTEYADASNGTPKTRSITGVNINPCGDEETECIEKSSDKNPDNILDPSSITVSLNNQGLATLSFVLTSKSKLSGDVGHFSLPLGSSTFNGYIINIQSEPLSGTDYYDHRITAIGEVE